MNMISEEQDSSLFQSFWWPFSQQKVHWFGPKAAAADLRFPAITTAAAGALKFICEMYATAGWGIATEGYNEAEVEIKEIIFSVKINTFICFISLSTNIFSAFHFMTGTLQGSFKREIEPLSLWVTETNLFRSETFSADLLKTLKIHSFFTDINTMHK